MLVTILIAVMPYCTPQKDPSILAACLDYFVQCVNGDLENNEEPCAEEIPEWLVP